MTKPDWTYESLYLKSQIFIERALTADRNTSLFPFWASLSLELIARSTLSFISPALLADPREGNNILYAFGYHSPKEPKSIAIKTVFNRLEAIIPDFSLSEEQFCQSFLNMRNEELHSGSPIFEAYTTNVWLIDFYKVLDILLKFQGKSLNDFIGLEEGEIAQQMITEYKQGLIKVVKDKINKSEIKYSALGPDEKLKKTENNNVILPKFIIKNRYCKEVICPACKNKGVLIGKLISQSSPKVKDDVIIIHKNLLPQRFKCFVCSLEIEGISELFEANFGGQFSIEESIDPVEFYEIDPIEHLRNSGYTYSDISEFLDYDYGND